LFAIALLAMPAFAAPRHERAAMNWVERAPLSFAALQKAVSDATLAEVEGTRPIVLLETNYYTFLTGESLQLRLTVHPNGFGAPVTMYLYDENRVTGQRRYYNVAGGLLAAGQQQDLFGTSAGPVPVFVPTLSDFVLFGSAGDTSVNSWGVNGALGASRPRGDAGQYQWVIELRDAAGKRVLSRSNAMYANIQGSVDVSGTIAANTTWTANNRYVLNEFVGVAAPATLTIEPGTIIYGGTSRATLFIQKGAKIVADGTARRPIIFTSPKRTGDRAQTDWGSLVVLGNAPINVPGGSAFLEGLPSEPAYSFGGNAPNESSGVLRYVRLEFGGFLIAQNQEINGLTMAGVGSGTIVDSVQVLHNKDDAFEFFGGTVNAKRLLSVAAADDGLDFDFGYTGSIQYSVLIKRAVNDESDSNFFTESDNNIPAAADAARPLTNPSVYNVTAVRVASGVGQYGGVLRRNTAGKFHNVIVTGSRLAPLTIRDNSTFTNANGGELVFDHSILHGSFEDSAFGSSDQPANTRNFLFTTMTRNRNTDPLLAIGTPTLVKTYMPDLEPLDDSPALDVTHAGHAGDGFIDAVDYIGAVGPGNNWVLSGWASFSDN
ncbi:MAG TPA: hypothetical protein VFO89_10470, partial [Thermoanaerobaculia bacterium]|nr:hypothetical protein [Thermoanaerobaculia bacterium]